MQTQHIPETVGALAGFSTILAQIPTPEGGGWLQIVIQAGMAGVVVVLLLKFFPMVMQHLKEKDAAHQQVIREIVESHREEVRQWQQIVQSKGVCPINENKKE